MYEFFIAYCKYYIALAMLHKSSSFVFEMIYTGSICIVLERAVGGRSLENWPFAAGCHTTFTRTTVECDCQSNDLPPPSLPAFSLPVHFLCTLSSLFLCLTFELCRLPSYCSQAVPLQSGIGLYQTDIRELENVSATLHVRNKEYLVRVCV